MRAGACITAIVNSGITTSSNTYELEIDGVVVTSSSLTLDTSSGTGGDPGDIVTSTPSAANSFVINGEITIVNTVSGNTDATVDVRFFITCKRT